jgi:hypothetical protein
MPDSDEEIEFIDGGNKDANTGPTDYLAITEHMASGGLIVLWC